MTPMRTLTKAQAFALWSARVQWRAIAAAFRLQACQSLLVEDVAADLDQVRAWLSS